MSAKSDLREVWNAPDRATAEAAIATFTKKYGAKYEKAVTCLAKDRDELCGNLGDAVIRRRSVLACW